MCTGTPGYIGLLGDNQYASLVCWNFLSLLKPRKETDSLNHDF